MSLSPNDLTNPITKTLSAPWRWAELFVIAAGIFFLLIMVPVWTTPGNDFFFQLSIIDPEVVAIMVILSFANALLIMMQLYIRKEVKAKKALHKEAAKGATAIGILFSSLSATVACAACYSSVLALLGLGTTTFIVEHRIWIAIGALALTAAAIFYSGKRINNHCEVCSIAPH